MGRVSLRDIGSSPDQPGLRRTGSPSTSGRGESFDPSLREHRYSVMLMLKSTDRSPGLDHCQTGARTASIASVQICTSPVRERGWWEPGTQAGGYRRGGSRETTWEPSSSASLVWTFVLPANDGREIRDPHGLCARTRFRGTIHPGHVGAAFDGLTGKGRGGELSSPALDGSVAQPAEAM